MIASSTSAPMAIAMPPSVIVLMEMPSPFMPKIATTSERGMATMEIAVARRFHRNRNRMTTTTMAPSRRACTTLRMATVMKSDCRNSADSIVTPAGSARCISASSVVTRAVSTRVLAPGCFCTARTTPLRAFTEPSP